MALLAEPEAVWKPRELTSRIRCDLDTVYRLLHEGRIRHVKLGREYRIPESAITEFLNGGASDAAE